MPAKPYKYISNLGVVGADDNFFIGTWSIGPKILIKIFLDLIRSTQI